MPPDQFAQLVARSESLSDVLRYFDLENKGGNHRTLKARLEAEEIDYSHIDLRRGAILVKRRGLEQRPLETVLVEHSRYSRRNLKLRLLASGMLSNECAICGQGPQWLGRPMTLVLDHINGVADDNRLANLRMLCPNCHSQTDTYCGANAGRAAARRRVPMQGELFQIAASTFRG